ncbi:ATP-grasp domain-containing protein [Pseudomonas syringae pv. actinidiae]|nr:ATP-grasp domain-containing protein [Pseudomonas syringae pv. actinidiae]
MNVIIAIEFKGPRDYLDALATAVHHFDDVNESFNHCVRRERGLEAHVLREAKFPFVAYGPEGEVLDTNVDLASLDRNQWRVLRRSLTRSVKSVAGFDSLLTDEDNQVIEHWPDVILSADRFLARDVSYFDKSEFLKKLAAGDLTFPLFIKGSDKGPTSDTSLRHIFNDWDALAEVFIRARYIPLIDQANLSPEDTFVLRFQKPDWYCPYRDDIIHEAPRYLPITTGIITSELMEITRDDLADSGTREYRCFVFNGKAYSPSRYSDYVSLPVPTALIEAAQVFADAQQSVLPIVYVVDIAETDKGFQVVELNQFSWSGRYLDNCPQKLFSDIQDHYNRDARFSLIEPLSTPEASHFESSDASHDLVAKFSMHNAQPDDEPWDDADE